MKSPYKIAVVGLWHLGEIYSAGLAELGHHVIGIDESEEVIQNLSKNIPPLEEPGLLDLIAKNKSAERLSYTTDLSRAKDCNVVWITHDTPVNDADEVQLQVVLASLKKITPHLADDALLVISSQIPVGTSKKIVESIREKRSELAFQYAYSPENLRLGDAVNCFMKPGRIVVGTDDADAAAIMKEIFAPLKTELVAMSTASAEMTKHALNAYLATSISFANDIADVCELYGADVEEVIQALKSDPRVGPKAYLFAGLGFSGGTLGRDLNALIGAAAAKNSTVPVIEGVLAKNRARNAIVSARLARELGSLKGKHLVFFGVTYKAGTSTLRRSQPLEIEKLLREAGATLSLYDPFAKKDEVAAITPSMFSSDPYAAAQGADAVLIMTPSKDFQMLDFAKLRAGTRGTLLYDTCNILWAKRNEVRAAGFTYICVGA